MKRQILKRCFETCLDMFNQRLGLCSHHRCITSYNCLSVDVMGVHFWMPERYIQWAFVIFRLVDPFFHPSVSISSHTDTKNSRSLVIQTEKTPEIQDSIPPLVRN